MGAAAGVIGRAAWRVGLSSSGEVVGRGVNLVLPFVVFAVHKADAHTDSFFLALAVAVFVQASLGGGLVSALVPEFVRSDERKSLILFGVLATGAGVAAGGVAAILANGKLPVWAAAISVGVMAAAGLLATPAVAVLNANHRYGAPGLCWALRLVPVGMFVMAEDAERQLAALLLGLAGTDALRAVILLGAVRDQLNFGLSSRQLRLPFSAASFILSSIVAGMSPLAVRWIASFHDTGSVSLFEAADRVYSSVASLATIGVGSVTLVYLARLNGSDQEEPRWRLILMVSFVWSILWLAVALAVWRWFPWEGRWFALQGTEGIRAVRDTFLCLAVGMSGFILTGVYGRRLLVVGLSHWLVPLSLAGLGCTLAAGSLLVRRHGVPGIGAGVSLAQYIVAALMILVLRRKGQHANTRSG